MGKNKLPAYFTINGIKYTVICKLADGGFASIFKAKANNQIFAIKRIGITNSNGVRVFRQEASIMKKLKSAQNIVQYVDHASTHSKNGIMEFFIVMELCKGSLLNLLKKNALNSFDSKKLLDIFLQICNGIRSLHYNNPPITHRDIKIENILINSSNQLVISDFGSCTNETLVPSPETMENIDKEVQSFTTLAYRSPEMINTLSGKTISTKSDIWALGCLLYKMIYHNTPFGENLSKIASGEFTFPATPECSQPIKDLIKYLLTVDPDERPNIYEVMCRVCSLLQVRTLTNPPPEHAIIPKSVTQVNSTSMPTLENESNGYNISSIKNSNSASLSPEAKNDSLPDFKKINPFAAYNVPDACNNPSSPQSFKVKTSMLSSNTNASDGTSEHHDCFTDKNHSESKSTFDPFSQFMNNNSDNKQNTNDPFNMSAKEEMSTDHTVPMNSENLFPNSNDSSLPFQKIDSSYQEKPKPFDSMEKDGTEDPIFHSSKPKVKSEICSDDGFNENYSFNLMIPKESTGMNNSVECEVKSVSNSNISENNTYYSKESE